MSLGPTSAPDKWHLMPWNDLSMQVHKCKYYVTDDREMTDHVTVKWQQNENEGSSQLPVAR